MSDNINHPAHYTQYPVEVIELAECLNYNRGTILKYVCRAGLKDPATEAEDLEKAHWYVSPEIARVKAQQEKVEQEREVRKQPVTVYQGDHNVGVGHLVWHPGGKAILNMDTGPADTLHDPLRYRAYSFRYDRPWGTKLGGDPA